MDILPREAVCKKQLLDSSICMSPYQSYNNKLFIFSALALLLSAIILFVFKYNLRSAATDATIDTLLALVIILAGFSMFFSWRLQKKAKHYEQHQAQSQLNLLYRQINQSDDAIYTISEARKIISWNNGAEKMYGYSSEEAIGKDPNELLQTVINDEEMKRAIAEIAIKNYWACELERKTRSGQTIIVRSSTTVLKETDGKIYGYITVNYDITSNKKLEQEVSHLASIVEQSSEAIFSRGTDHRIISWNRGAEQLFGYTKQEAIGRTASSLKFFRLSPEQVSNAEKEIMETGLWKHEMNYYHRDGSAFFGAVTANYIRDSNGAGGAFYFIVKDISDSKNREDTLVVANEELEQKVKERTAELYKSEQRFRALVENSSDIISLMDESLRIIYRSPSAERITGWTFDELDKVEATRNIHPEDMAYGRAILNESLSKPGKPINTIFRNLHKDGHYIWVEGTVTNLLKDESVKALVFNFRDVTQNKEAAEKLKASEERFRHSLDGMLEGVQIIGFDRRYIYVNDAMARHFRYAKEELIGHTVIEKYPGIENTEIYKVYQRCFDDRVAMHLENEFVFPDKSVGWFELSFQPVPEGIFILSVDITERKAAERNIRASNERFEMVSTATNDAIWDLDIVSGQITRTGTGFKTLFGYENEFATIGQAYRDDLVHPQDMAGVVESIDQAFNNPNQSYWEKEYRFLKKDGSYAHVYDKGYIIRDKDHKAVRMIGATQDITRLRENELHLLKLNESLQVQAQALTESNAELEQFAYVASHDLQEPLRMVTNFLTLLEKNYSDTISPSGKRYISFAVDGAKRMRQIILDLLEFSRIGRNPGTKETINLNKLVAGIVLLYQKDIADKHAVITVGKLPVLFTYATPLQQVFQNLVSNALKYTRCEVPPRINISASDMGDHWECCVSDNGIGIDKEYFDKIFIIFQRLHNSSEFSGTGIGLAITRKIIDHLGGKIWLKSAPDQGSSFYFTLKK